MGAIPVIGILGLALLPGAVPAGAATWQAYLAAMDEALDDQDVGRARRAWREAHLAAQGSWHWEGLVEVADGCLRLARSSSTGRASVPEARSLYLAALFRARQQRSVEGMLRAAEGFYRLDDHLAAGQALSLAEGLAAESGDVHDRALIRGFAERVARGRRSGR
jgi:hypothetical protein